MIAAAPVLGIAIAIQSSLTEKFTRKRLEVIYLSLSRVY